MRHGHKHWSDVETSVLTRLGLANGIGATLSFYTGTLVDSTSSTNQTRYLFVFLAYLAVFLPVGGAVAHHDVHGVTAWRSRGATLSPAKRKRVLNLPLRQAVFSFGYWLGAAVLFGALNWFVEDFSLVYSLRVAGTVVLGGLTTAGIAFLLLEQAMRPVFREMFAVELPEENERLGIRTRLLVSWALGSAIPLLIIALAFVGRSPDDNANLRVAVWALTAVGIAAGAIVMTMAARSISEPLDSIRAALARVQRDDLDVDVPVDDAGEVGQLEAGFNRMVAGLRDRRALEDLFGRHVGTEVAAQAREQGVRLGGERREASIVFVDLVGSSRLAQSRAADEVVKLLNTFFATVVERIEQEGGWVNKFEGDAALCVFGAPADQPDHATRAFARGAHASPRPARAVVGASRARRWYRRVGRRRRRRQRRCRAPLRVHSDRRSRERGGAPDRRGEDPPRRSTRERRGRRSRLVGGAQALGRRRRALAARPQPAHAGVRTEGTEHRHDDSDLI